MARKVSGGIAGEPSLGAVQITSNAVFTAADDQDITLSPSGTGSLVLNNNAVLNGQKDLRFGDSDTSHWVAFQAPATVSSNVTWTLPAADAASAGYSLVSNAAGVLSWSQVGPVVTDETLSASSYYPMLTTTTSGQSGSVSISSTKISFQPSTGTLTATLAAFSGLSSSGTIAFTGTTTARQLNPETTNTYDLGTSSLRWRNIYTQDLHLSNGIGDYTVVEGEEDLFLVNNKTNKSFKFALIEVDASEVPPLSETSE